MKIVAGLPEQEYQRRYREANKDRVAERQRRYYEANKDKVAERQRRYYEANKDKVAERQRRYYEANKDKLADGSVPIARKFERRNCPLFEDCLEKAAIKDWRRGPCPLCAKLDRESVV